MRWNMKRNEQTPLIQNYIAAYNGFDVDSMLTLVSPEVRFENWSGGQFTTEVSGIDEFRQLAFQAKASSRSENSASTQSNRVTTRSSCALLIVGSLRSTFPTARERELCWTLAVKRSLGSKTG